MSEYISEASSDELFDILSEMIADDLENGYDFTAIDATREVQLNRHEIKITLSK